MNNMDIDVRRCGLRGAGDNNIIDEDRSRLSLGAAFGFFVWALAVNKREDLGVGNRVIGWILTDRLRLRGDSRRVF
jgi:hypothetical protein